MRMRRSSLAAWGALGVGLALAWLAQGQAGARGEEAGRPERIVCLTPSVTEAVFALGAGERVVGVTDYCTEPAEAQTRVRLGGIFNPNFERLVALRPDLVIVQGRAGRVGEFCRARGLELVTVEMADVEAVLGDMERLGEVLGCEERAGELCGQMRAELAAVQAKVAGRERPRVFLSLYRTGGSLSALTTATDGTYLGELIRLAGGENVFGDLRQDYPQVSKEALLRREVEVIIEPTGAGMTGTAEQRERLADWARLGPVPAVEQGRVYFPAAQSLLRPGPRLAEAARTLAELIHPEVFGE